MGGPDTFKKMPEAMPKGFLTLEQFEKDLRSVVGSTKMPLKTPGERHEFALTTLCQMLDIEKENEADIDYLADHMADERSGVIEDILTRLDTPRARGRMRNLHEEIVHFEQHRDERHVPRRKDEGPES